MDSRAKAYHVRHGHGTERYAAFYQGQYPMLIYIYIYKCYYKRLIDMIDKGQWQHSGRRRRGTESGRGPARKRREPRVKMKSENPRSQSTTRSRIVVDLPQQQRQKRIDRTTRKRGQNHENKKKATKFLSAFSRRIWRARLEKGTPGRTPGGKPGGKDRQKSQEKKRKGHTDQKDRAWEIDPTSIPR
ncbi:hypothetical protein TBLA_0A02370 [Henningerozyma blattae CBS 6284]|uniref:Uncharacterized protein n=1 Tax=Henningerozyma blattae (strain ATCC 34711 / CBS 6284 / DSM 70876 / NBRC 10599 / NRRL Y-10934 / UCD 77-7) TaxID=1071380 RepID=I2GV84_HENB6|nr:hypothetical protein TBLA_0A02370 [Tetrapisispora blattae CBS 6284]CCH58036.1 hypothetical protein TBLA_0A02370 [Tetrapisispora blattae CBS 6284]